MDDWEDRQNSDIEDLGGRGHPGSGNKWYLESDGSRKYFRFEHKTTNKDRITVSAKVLRKLKSEALRSQQRPILVVNIQNDFVWGFVPDYLGRSMVNLQSLPKVVDKITGRTDSHIVSCDHLEDLLKRAGNAALPVMEVELSIGWWWGFPAEHFKRLLDGWEKAQENPDGQ